MGIRTMIFNLLYAMFWAGGITFVVILIVDGITMPFKKNQALREARDAGHEIIAKRVEFKHQRGQQRRKYIWGYYEYEYKNCRYTYKNTFQNMPPDTITLYFKNNPKKARPEGSFGGIESGYGWIFLVSTGILFLMRITG